MFVESSITALVSGTVARPLTDRCRVSREKLAYVCDSVSAPVCSMVPFNAWGALLLGLIAAQISAGVIGGNAVEILISAVLMNFYALTALGLLFYIIWSGKDFGPMKKAEQRAEQEGKLLRDGAVPMMDESMMQPEAACGVKPDILNMVLPLLVMVGMVPVGLWITGGGDMLKGEGSTAIFWAVLSSVTFSGLFYTLRGVMRLGAFIRYVNTGSAAMFPVVAILIFAFAIGSVTVQMQTGQYLASLAEGVVSPHIVAALVFLMAAAISFATGTSWGTFSIMMPIAVQMAAGLDAPVSLAVAAVISGGVFGDHCSVISDTTIVASMAAGSDLVDHVNTQLPYALLSGGIALVLFLLFGFLL
jgi:Na+/H+ antiporter NhaC